MMNRRGSSHRRYRYTLEYKKKVLQSIRQIGIGKTLRKMNVKNDQVKYWMQKEDEIMNTPSEDCVGRFRLGRALYSEFAQEEQQIYDWIMEKKKNGETVLNDEIIERAAVAFSSQPDGESQASRKWLISFKRRFGLVKEPGIKRGRRAKEPEELRVPAEPPVELRVPAEPKALVPELQELDVPEEPRPPTWEERWEEELLGRGRQQDDPFMSDTDKSEPEPVREPPEVISLDDD